MISKSYRWERNIFSRIFGPVKENSVWRIRTNQEMTNLYRETDITSEIGKGRSRSLGHVERMSEKRSVKKVFNNTPEGRKKDCWKAKRKWLDEAENDLKKTDVKRLEKNS